MKHAFTWRSAPLRWLAASAGLVVALALGLTTAPQPAQAATIPFSLQSFATGLSNPVDIRSTGVAGDSRLFVVQQGGQIVIVSSTGAITGTFLDISGLVQSSGEEGLLGLAFDPNYQTNGYFYVYYTIKDTTNNRLSRFTRNTTSTADPASQKVMMEFSHPGQTNHNGGGLQFGPDGHLYVSTGDGGGGGDPNNNAQNKQSRLGKILRIDNSTNSAVPYTVPSDNPYVGNTAYLPEIAYLGLRNPWRFSFDRQTGDLLVADVGQGNREEVDFKTTGQLGDNFGWRCYEGTQPYNTAGCAAQNTYTGPINEYDHSLGCSITGGYRYRGSKYPVLQGKYVFTDYCSGRFWTLTQSGGSWSRDEQLRQGSSYSTFGEGTDGELYVATLGGTIYQVQSGPVGSQQTFRFWSPRQGNAHFYTQSTAERDQLINNDDYSRGGNWVYEGVAFVAVPPSGGTCSSSASSFRFYSPTFRSHFYTSSTTERDQLQNNDRYGAGGNWTYEGISYCAESSQVTNTKPLYRFWSPVFRKHFYTASESERTQLGGDANWQTEGIAHFIY